MRERNTGGSCPWESADRRMDKDRTIDESRGTDDPNVGGTGLIWGYPVSHVHVVLSSMHMSWSTVKFHRQIINSMVDAMVNTVAIVKSMMDNTTISPIVNDGNDNLLLMMVDNDA